MFKKKERKKEIKKRAFLNSQRRARNRYDTIGEETIQMVSTTDMGRRPVSRPLPLDERLHGLIILLREKERTQTTGQIIIPYQEQSESSNIPASPQIAVTGGRGGHWKCKYKPCNCNTVKISQPSHILICLARIMQICVIWKGRQKHLAT